MHGAPHWTRVLENGLRLAEFTGANPKVGEQPLVTQSCLNRPTSEAYGEPTAIANSRLTCACSWRAARRHWSRPPAPVRAARN